MKFCMPSLLLFSSTHVSGPRNTWWEEIRRRDVTISRNQIPKESVTVTDVIIQQLCDAFHGGNSLLQPSAMKSLYSLCWQYHWELRYFDQFALKKLTGNLSALGAVIVECSMYQFEQAHSVIAGKAHEQTLFTVLYAYFDEFAVKYLTSNITV